MLPYKSIFIAATIFGAGAVPLAAHAAPENLPQKIDALLEKSYSAEDPGAAVVVTEDGKIIYSGGRGLADLEQSRAITPETVFRMASITKQFASATLLQLVQEGQLSLDDPLSKFLPDYPDSARDVTVRHLLNHTSGIQSYTGVAEMMIETSTSKPFTTEELIAQFKDRPHQFAPGTSFAYNNSGYILVGAIIEAVTGTSWDQAIVNRISRPLGLGSIASFEDEDRTPGMAKGYTAGDDGTFTYAQKIHASVPAAAGALRGTVLDLARWADALHGGEVIDRQYYEMMIAPTALADGSTRPYGFGIVPSEIRGRTAIGHSGGIFGFSTDSVYLPNANLFVAIFANADTPESDPSTVMRRIAALALDEPYPEFTQVEVDAAELSALFGEYRISDGDTRQFYAREGKFYTLRSGGSESEVFAAGDDRFFYGPGSLTWMAIVSDDAGNMRMEMHQNGAAEPEIATYAGPISESTAVTVPRAVLERYVGTYSSAVGEFTIAWGDGDTLTGKLGPQPALNLTPLSDTSFAVQRVDAAITMTMEDGAVTGLVIEQGGQQLPAQRMAETD